ncbi:DEAD/DEAH box helicase [Sinimarinibacterium sp. CAU 1509]|uniref:DEAD/DEAH box helicase n=1 Tax=Sinimarinibacterium sp. CAU 1509 TaxID=2562283 RepID=UPI0010AC15E0|nr:DEAD/DEAH box helicase [Sinimarinibacterium sp. CAU 1509]TJY55016.1 DEAD/DEAH box helicase [Sinimarinibacterium sp. CAU 1509]
MNISQDEWQQLRDLPIANLKGRVFGILQNAAATIQTHGTDEPHLLEIVPRLADLLSSKPELKDLREAFSSLARATGLWNYIDKEDSATIDLLVAESVTVQELDGVTLHREQVAALNDLLAGRNLILSAPTSFGKSLLIDALLASGKYSRVAIVLPTIALLDEFRRRLKRRFAERFNLIMHPADRPKDGCATIFLGTQERLITRTDLGKLDLTVVDEFYKLDPNRRDDRSITLNAAVSKLLNRSNQFFFLGPNIDDVRISGDGRWKFEFLRTRFSTVAVDTYDLGHVTDKETRLFDEIAEERHWPALVFVSAPDKANRLASQAADLMAISDSSADFAQWLSENVGPGSPLVETVRFGFGVHHGRLPRAIASQMVRMFNQKDLPVLFCTSTLIEGVNTAAKTVLIFDKTINREDYDFFTYSNIKGRAGRLGEHHVGQVYLFNAPPEHALTEVAPTLFGDQDDAPDDYVVHLEEQDATRRTDTRVATLKMALGLDADGLRLAASVGLEHALALKQAVQKALTENDNLVWAGFPKYPKIKAVVDVICSVRRAGEFGAFTASQLTYFISDLRRARSMRDFLLTYDNKYKGKQEAYDTVFKFLRACEYGLPQHFSVVEIFVKQHAPATDYSLFIESISRWFKPEELKNLDEEGIPIQISERFYDGEDKEQLVKKLLSHARSRSQTLSAFEKKWIIAALE